MTKFIATLCAFPVVLGLLGFSAAPVSTGSTILIISTNNQTVIARKLQVDLRLITASLNTREFNEIADG